MPTAAPETEEEVDVVELEAIAKTLMVDRPGQGPALPREQAVAAARRQLLDARTFWRDHRRDCLGKMNRTVAPAEDDPDIVLWWVLFERMDVTSAFHRCGGPRSLLANKGAVRAYDYLASVEDRDHGGKALWYRNLSRGHAKTVDTLRARDVEKARLVELARQGEADRTRAAELAGIAAARQLAETLKKLPVEERRALLGEKEA